MQAQGANTPLAQHLATPGTNPSFTDTNTMFICGINSPTVFQGDSQTKWVYGKLFDDDFISYMDKKVKELDDEIKSYSTLTAMNSQIRLNKEPKKEC